MILFFSKEFFLFFIKLIPFWVLAVLIQVLIQNFYYKKYEKKIEENFIISDSLGFIEDNKSNITRKVDLHYRKLLFMYSYKPFLIQLFDTVNNENKFNYILTNIFFDNQDLVIRFNKINERKSYRISLKRIEEAQLPVFLQKYLSNN